MGKISCILSLSILVACAPATGWSQTVATTVTGFVTDTQMGKHGANELHADASKGYVAAGMAVYAIYDEGTKKLYVLAPQGTGGTYVGQRVTVTGTLGPSALHHAGQVVNKQTNVTEDMHHVGQDSTTPIGGVLTITSIAVAQPGPPAKASSEQ
jgi:hypothetical protein